MRMPRQTFTASRGLRTLTATLLLTAAAADATTRYVSPGGGHAWPYTNWVDAATNLQPAIDAADLGDTVLVTNGTYGIAPPLTITQGITVVSMNGAGATLLDGLHSNPVAWVDASNAVLAGFTITNGVTTDSSGGGAWIGPGSALLDSVVTGCAAPDGGGVFTMQGTLSNCTFTGNTADYAGGAICAIGGSILGCSFLANTARYGGGVAQMPDGPVSRIDGCTFISNTAGCGGGLIHGALTNIAATTNIASQLFGLTNLIGQLNYAGDMLTNMLSRLPDLSSSTLTARAFPVSQHLSISGAPGYFAGDLPPAPRSQTNAGILSAPPTVTISDCLMTSNVASLGGGAYCLDSPSLVMGNCSLRQNTAQSGGGLAAWDAGEIIDTALVENRASYMGGGALVYGATRVRNATFITNYAGTMGGGGMVLGPAEPVVIANTVLASGSEQPRVEDTVLDGNHADNWGGGLVVCYASAARLTLTGNHAEWGGGLACLSAEADDCLVLSNSASFGGGYFGIEGRLSRSTLRGNSADWMGGGALAIDSTTPALLIECVVANNRAAGGGGVGLLGSAHLTASTITNNVAVLAGGGAYCLMGGTIQSSLLSRNVARDGGGVYCATSGRLVNDTLAGNAASNRAGGLAVITDETPLPQYLAPATMLNTIVYGNDAPGSENVLTFGTNMTYSYCCIDPLPVPGGEGNFSDDPLLTPSGHLRSASPCIDAGYATGAPVVDLDGEARWDDPRHSNLVSIVDIGADEFVDDDLDTMADTWETACFGSTTNRTGIEDDDHDGLADTAEYEHGTVPTRTDTDGDGMPDGWEVYGGLDALANEAHQHADRDGSDNLAEYIADTEPTNGDSVLTLLGARPEHGGVRIDWKGGVQAWQVIEYCTNLAAANTAWEPLLGFPLPTPPTNAVIDMNATNGVRFYRIRADR